MADLGLDATTAMVCAQEWYNTQGPYRNSYQMLAHAATKLGELEWLVQFRVTPDTGFLYHRRFVFRSENDTCLVDSWSEDPTHPDTADASDFEPEEDDEEDEEDMQTLEQEEFIAHACRESNANEVSELQQDNDLSLADLMAKYGYDQAPKEDEAEAGAEADAGVEADASAEVEVEAEAEADEEPPAKRVRIERTEPTAARTAALLASSEEEEEEDEDWSFPVAQVRAEMLMLPKPVKLGPEYQADVPLSVDDVYEPPQGLLGAPLWTPPAEASVMADVAQFVAEVTANNRRPTASIEAALQALQAHNMDIAAARREWAPIEVVEWPVEHIEAFENGLRAYGKSFHMLQTEIPSHSVRSVIGFYYSWKKSARYEVYLRRMFSRKLLFAPGHDLTLGDSDSDDNSSSGAPGSSSASGDGGENAAASGDGDGSADSSASAEGPSADSEPASATATSLV